MNILFVDDEPRRMALFVEELEQAGFSVSFETDPDRALGNFCAHPGMFHLIVLDISMRAGPTFADDDTHEGLRTGVHLYDKIRLVDRTIPIVVLTNVPDARVARRFENEFNCWFVRKADVLPFQFANTISSILKLPGQVAKGGFQ